MANRYWVGGTGNWDATTTNWSASSGGAGGASVPTLADDVFFDTLSNATAYVVTLTTAPVCRSVSVAGPVAGNVTIAGAVNWFVYGSFTLAATGVTWTVTSAIIFAATTSGWTITTNGVTLTNGLTFNGVGGVWTLGSALTSTSGTTTSHLAGTFNTNNFNFTQASAGFSSTGALVRALNLGSSAISCNFWSAFGATNLTLNAGTSTITLSSVTFSGGGLTYYNVFRAQNGISIGDANNTFNALTMNNVTATSTVVCAFAGNQTIGTLTINGGTNATARASIQTSITLVGTQITLTVGTFVTNGYIDFRDINLAGAASPLTVSTGGDCGNNTNITLATPKTVYWSLAAGGNLGTSTAWALTSGGAPALANYPLPQDTAIIEDTGLNSGATITLNTSLNIGTLTFATRSLPMTFALTNFVPYVYGDLTFSSAVTTTATTAVFTFSGFNKTQTITSAGTSIPFGITVLGRLTTVALSGALTSTATTTLTQGTLNLANNNLTATAFSSNNSNTRAITFGTGQIYVTGTGVAIDFNTMTGFTYTGSGVFNYSSNLPSGGRTCIFGFTAGGTETNALNINFTAGTDFCAVYGAGIRSLNFTGYAGNWVPTGGQTIYGGLTLSSEMTVTSNGNLIFAATSGTQNITSNGKTATFPIFKNGAGTLRLVDALTLGSTLTFTHTAGSIDLNAQNATIGLFSSTGALTRSIAFGGGTMAVSGATFTASGTNLTTTGSGVVNMTSASSKTFAGGGFSYPTLNQGGAGALVITGANTFANMTNTVRPCTITFPASTTTTVSNFNVNGTAGNLVTLNSSTPGTRFTLAKI